jgi:hypothetical protein
MVAMFSTPILSVAADAVRDLEGRDALSGLWTSACLVYISLFPLAGLYNFFLTSSFHEVQGVTTEWSTT